MASRETTPARKQRKGLKQGPNSELNIFLTVRPGREKQIRQALDERFALKPGQSRAMIAREKLLQAGAHDIRHYLFDNDRRLQLLITFDKDWDTYLDDAIAAVGKDNFYAWLQHCNEIPEGGIANVSVAAIKEILHENQVEAITYIETIPDMTIGEIHKAQQVQRAFQQVLDHPEAAQALKHPALKPLLELAAD